MEKVSRVTSNASSSTFQDGSYRFFVLSGGASGAITVRFAGSGCSWSVSASGGFTSINGPTSGTSDGTSLTIPFTIGENAQQTPAHSQLQFFVNSADTAAILAFVYQNSSACSATVSPQSVNIPAAGMSGTFTLNTVDFCYNENFPGSWVTLTTSDSITFTYSVSVNTGTVRTTTVSFNTPPTSSMATFTFNQAAGTNPTLPTITSLDPSSASVGGPGFTLTASGTGFSQGDVVWWNGRDALPTTYVSSTQLTASVPASETAMVGSVPVQVMFSGVNLTNALTFSISQAIPTLTSLNPSSATAGGPAFTLTVNGTGFASGAVVNWASNRCQPHLFPQLS